MQFRQEIPKFPALMVMGDAWTPRRFWKEWLVTNKEEYITSIHRGYVLSKQQKGEPDDKTTEDPL